MQYISMNACSWVPGEGSREPHGLGWQSGHLPAMSFECEESQLSLVGRQTEYAGNCGGILDTFMQSTCIRWTQFESHHCTAIIMFEPM